MGPGQGQTEQWPRVSLDLHESHTPWGQTQRATLGVFLGCFRSSPAPDGPPNLGVARICWGVLPGRYSTDFLTDLYGLSWAIYS